MAKTIPPSEGFPIKEIARDIMDDPLQSYFRFDPRFEKDEAHEFKEEIEFLRHFFWELTNFTNEDVCATNKQITALLDHLISHTDSATPSRPYTIPFGDRHIQTSFDFYSYVNLANSFRLDCANCLNKDCTRRDPECPVSEVEKRVPPKK